MYFCIVRIHTLSVADSVWDSVKTCDGLEYGYVLSVDCDECGRRTRLAATKPIKTKLDLE